VLESSSFVVSLFLADKGASAREAFSGRTQASGAVRLGTFARAVIPPPAEQSAAAKVGGNGMKMINVVLVGTNNLFRQGLRRLLDPSQFLVAGEARDLVALDALLEAGPAPDLVVADLNGCHDDDLESLRALRSAHEEVRIVVLANELCLSDMARLLKAGADGYLVNELSAEAFSLSLLLVMKGEKALPSTLAGILANDSSDAGNGALIQAQKHLTEREKQILKCLLQAYSNKHIARALNISEGTVKVHLKSLMKKIAAANRTQAALWARNNGIENGQLMAG
jgi:two-component system, NarL family, nitrate/nitrite response regulator NarL